MRWVLWPAPLDSNGIWINYTGILAKSEGNTTTSGWHCHQLVFLIIRYWRKLTLLFKIVGNLTLGSDTSVRIASNGQLSIHKVHFANDSVLSKKEWDCSRRAMDLPGPRFTRISKNRVCDGLSVYRFIGLCFHSNVKDITWGLQETWEHPNVKQWDKQTN